MFEEAGVDYPTDDWTWDDVVAAGKAITVADEEKWGLTNPGTPTNRGVYFYQADGSPYSEDFKNATLDSPGVVEAYKWLWDLIYTHEIAPPAGKDFGINPFLSGRVAMEFNGIWMLADWSTITEFEWDMALLPKHPQTGKRTTTLEADGWWIFKDATDPELAWDLLSYMVEQRGTRYVRLAQLLCAAVYS